MIRNLKSLVLKMDEEAEDIILELRASKKGAVTAKAIGKNASVEVVNVKHHILELTEDRELRMDLYVNKGRGFVLAEQHEFPRNAPADLVRIDAIYNPVRRANFVVEETRVGQRTDFDRLVLEVETNGAMDVRSAVQYAARLAIEHFSFLSGSRPQWTEDEPWGDGSTPAGTRAPFAGGAPVPPRIEEMLSRPIEELAELGVRSRNSLQKENIQTLGDLVQKTEGEMLNIDNFGKKSLQEIIEFLETQGLRFGVRFQKADDGMLWWDGEDGANGGAEGQ